MINPGDRIPLPERGFTCTPPWPQAIARAGKRLVNRAPGIAATVRDYRGLVAISQSKTWDRKQAVDEIRDLRERLTGLPWQKLPNERAWAGKIVLVAELKEVMSEAEVQRRSSHSSAGSLWESYYAAWHIPGNSALNLGRVWEVEPLPFSGAVGIWYAGQCPICMTVQGRQGVSQACRKCKAQPSSEPGPRSMHCWQRPMLTITRECTI
jgi:hypothetical protein